MREKKIGLSQKMIAEKLGVCREIRSKCKTYNTLPDVHKKISRIYILYLDELMEFDIELNKIKKNENSNEEKDLKIDWIKARLKYILF